MAYDENDPPTDDSFTSTFITEVVLVTIAVVLIVATLTGGFA